MKYFTLLLIICLSTFGCSNDDNNSSSMPPNTMTLKLNGAPKTLNVTATEGMGSATYYIVVGTIGANENIVFSTYDPTGDGDYGYDDLTYTKDGIDYVGSFEGDINNNSETNKLQGTFSGQLSNQDNTATITITDGKFNATY